MMSTAGYPASPAGHDESGGGAAPPPQEVATAAATSIRDESAVCAAMLRLLGPDRELCDFTFVVGEEAERLPAVKAVVAVRSPPLRSMLYDQSFRMAQQELAMPHWSPRAFRYLLEFMHAGVANVDAETVLELMQLADFLQVDELKIHCKEFLTEHLSPATVSTLLAEAIRFNDASLRARCTDFFLANARLGPLTSRAFCTFPEWLVCELLSDSALNADEWEVYEAVKAWIAARQKACRAEPERTSGGGGRERSPKHSKAPAPSVAVAGERQRDAPKAEKTTDGDTKSERDEDLVLESDSDDGDEPEVAGDAMTTEGSGRPGAALTDMSPTTSSQADSAFAAGHGPLECVRLGQMSVDQLQAMRIDGLIPESRMLDAVLRKLDGAEPTEGRRRTVFLDFRFDTASKGDGVQLSDDGHSASFSKDNCVLGETMVPDVGQAYWEVMVSSGTNAYIGIARRERIDTQRNMGSGGGIAFRGIGGNEKWKECSHFEYGRRLARGDRVGVLVDLPARSISFYLNGEPLGLAFDDLDPAKQYWPCVSNNTGEMCLVQSRRLPA
mmetsp:Transcript_33897/g.97537  ORF Transcript_33897/g.97537 Transcript_33897/m.97537 type:complete len:556 (+) Transcript_33897:61-1728(+)